MEDVVPATSARIVADPPSSAYKIYDASTPIEYTPELALQHGLKMVNKLAASLDGLQLGPRRREVWLRDTARFAAALSLISLFLISLFFSLRSQGVPSTLIAICGGKFVGASPLEVAHQLSNSDWSWQIVYSERNFGRYA